MRIAVIDGQGGGIGKHIIEKLRKVFSENVEIIALGTNALATLQMIKAGANEGASGENAIVNTVRKVDYIIGNISIVIPNSMLGELTPKMAEAISESGAKKFLIPLLKDDFVLIGVSDEPLPHLIDELVHRLKAELGDEKNV